MGSDAVWLLGLYVTTEFVTQSQFDARPKGSVT